MPGSGVAGSCNSSVYVFEELPCFPWWLYHFTFPPTVHKGSNFSASSATLAVFCVLTVALLLGAGRYLRLWCALPSWSVSSCSSRALLAISSLEKCLFESFAHFGISLICLFIFELDSANIVIRNFFSFPVHNVCHVVNFQTCLSSWRRKNFVEWNSKFRRVQQTFVELCAGWKVRPEDVQVYET